ncbi:MAG: barstar family protein [Dehalococcoidia bacterium]|nr:barstar family protein [Dehalococcoidia bacterium]
MQDWKDIFGRAANSGIHRAGADVDEAELRTLAAARGLDFTLVDLRNVPDKAGFLGEVSNALLFPSYFGMNWDALSDCLTDMSWKLAVGYVLFLRGFQTFAEAAGEDAAVAVQILGVAAHYWRQKGVPFYAVLSD